MNAGYDQPVFPKNTPLANTEGQVLNLINKVDIDDAAPILVNNIVYCRDPRTLEDKTACMNIRNLVHHENNLDLKSFTLPSKVPNQKQ